MISLEDGTRLLKLARDSVEEEFSGKRSSDREMGNRYSEKQGVFVTIHKDGRLRGCIGFPQPIYPLYEAVQKAAKHAAFRDPRFHPVTEEELEDLEFEISVLSVPRPIKNDPSEVKVGRDGLIIQGAYSSGLLLPQVATEHGWDAQEFLRHTCEKASLEEDFWKSEDAKIFSFQAQVFKETEEGVVEERTDPSC